MIKKIQINNKFIHYIIYKEKYTINRKKYKGYFFEILVKKSSIKILLSDYSVVIKVIKN